MRRLVIALAAVLLALPVFAGEPLAGKDYSNHSVYAGYSILNAYAHQNRDDIEDFSGLLNIGYEYRPLKMLGLGADVGWMSNVGRHRRQVEYAGGVSLPESIPFRTDYFFISASLRGIWVDREHFSCYSGVRAGVELKTGGTPYPCSFNFQFVPVGLEAGVSRVGAYAELALGVCNSVSFGIRFHF